MRDRNGFVPLKEVKEIAVESITQNIGILQALSDNDRGGLVRAGSLPTFMVVKNTRLEASVGTVSGSIVVQQGTVNSPTQPARMHLSVNLESVAT
jgi:hypothetical protein